MSGRRTSKFAGASKPSGGRSEQTDRWTRGDTTSISALLACAVVVVILGAIYLAAYMKVAYQGRQIHNLQVALTAETARQHALINDIGWRESPGRIAEKAKEMGMVMGGKADYVVVHTSTARVTTNSNPATMAVTTPSLGPGTLGDN
jgi:cell division protein FtsL